MKTLKRITLLIICSLSFNISYAQSPVNSVGSGCALDFNGLSNYVSSPSTTSLSIGSSFTVEVWIKLMNLTDYPVIISKGTSVTQRLGIQIFPNGSVCGYFTGTCNILTPANVITIQKWYHVVYVFNDSSNSNTIYINGDKVATNIETGVVNATNGVLNIGRSVVLNTRYVNGQMDEVRIWNYARTQTEIQQNMCKKLTGTEAGLVGYWRFDDCGGLTTADASGNGNNGTLH